MKNKKILFLLPAKYMGGAEYRAIHIAEYAAANEFKGIVSFYPYKTLIPLRKAFQAIGFIYNKGVVADWAYKGWWGLKRNIILIFSFFSTLYLILKHKPDSVFINLSWPYAATGSLFACAILKKKTIVRFALITETMEKNVLRDRILKWAQSRNQFWVALSNNNRQLLIKNFSVETKRIKLIYNAYSEKNDYRVLNDYNITLREEMDILPDSRILLTVGALEYRKGHDILLPAIKNLIAKYPNVYFLWVGSGSLENMYRSQLTLHGIENRVLMMGSRKDIPRLMNESDLFVFPSRSEGLPNVLLEAINHKLPIVTSNTSSMPEIIQHNSTGLLAEPESSSDFEKKMAYAIENPENMDSLAKNALNKLNKTESFSYKKMMESYLRLFQA